VAPFGAAWCWDAGAEIAPEADDLEASGWSLAHPVAATSNPGMTAAVPDANFFDPSPKRPI